MTVGILFIFSVFFLLFCLYSSGYFSRERVWGYALLCYLGVAFSILALMIIDEISMKG